MGAWGVGPLDNDTAGDWVLEHIQRAADKTIVGFLKNPDGLGKYEKALAAVAVLVAIDVCPFETEVDAERFFEESDEQEKATWGRWRDAAERKKAMKALRKQVFALV